MNPAIRNPINEITATVMAYGNWVETVVVCARIVLRRCHDGGVGDGRAMVAEDGASQAGGHADDEQWAVGREYVDDDWDQDAEGAQLVPVAKDNPHATRKMTAGTSLPDGGGALHQGGDKFLGLKQAGHV